MYTKKEFNPKLEKKKAYISLFSIIICQLINIIPLLWFDFGVLFTTIFFSLIELYITIKNNDNLYEGRFKYTCDKATLTQQINTYKSIHRLWIFTLTFFCLNNLLFFILSCIFTAHYFEIQRLITYQIYDNPQYSILFDFLYCFDLNTIHSNLWTYNFITMLMFFIRGLLAIELINEYKNIDKKMACNESIQKILVGNKRLNKDLICNLIDKNDKDHRRYN